MKGSGKEGLLPHRREASSGTLPLRPMYLDAGPPRDGGATDCRVVRSPQAVAIRLCRIRNRTESEQVLQLQIAVLLTLESSLCTPAVQPSAGHEGQTAREASSSATTVITKVAYIEVD